MNIIDRLKWAANDVFDEAKSGIWKNFGTNLLFVFLLTVFSIITSIGFLYAGDKIVGNNFWTLTNMFKHKYYLLMWLTKVITVLGLYFYANVIIRRNDKIGRKVSFKNVVQLNSAKDVEGFLIYTAVTALSVIIVAFSLVEINFGGSIFGRLLPFIGSTTISYLPYLILIILLKNNNKKSLVPSTLKELFIVTVVGVSFFEGFYSLVYPFFQQLTITIFYDSPIGINYFSIALSILIFAFVLTMASTGLASIVGARKSDPSV